MQLCALTIRGSKALLEVSHKDHFGIWSSAAPGTSEIEVEIWIYMQLAQSVMFMSLEFSKEV